MITKSWIRQAKRKSALLDSAIFTMISKTHLNELSLNSSLKRPLRAIAHGVSLAAKSIKQILANVPFMG